MIEVEIKVKISDPEQIRKKIVEIGGKYKISLIHDDIYYNMPKGLRNFAETDEALRIRESIEFDKENEDQQQKKVYYFTYKGKKIDDSTKTRNEYETKVGDGAVLFNILEHLGFQRILNVKKERELYEISFKGIKIEALIDYVPFLENYFLEVESMSNNIDKVEDNRNVLFKFLEEVNLKKDDSIRESYLELILFKMNQ